MAIGLEDCWLKPMWLIPTIGEINVGKVHTAVGKQADFEVKYSEDFLRLFLFVFSYIVT